MKTLVVGGTGLVGSAVVKELLHRKADVRLMVRKQDKSVLKGVEVAIGDLLDPPAVAMALDGVDQLYLLNAVVPDELTQGLIAYDLAKRLKLKRVVYHSVFRVDQFKDVHTSLRSWRSRMHCASSPSPSRLFGQTTSCRTMHR